MSLLRRVPTQTVSHQPQPGMDESVQTLTLGDTDDNRVSFNLIAPNPEAPKNAQRRVTNYRTFMIEFFTSDKYSVPPQVTIEMATQFIKTLCQAVKKYITDEKIVSDYNKKTIDESIYNESAYFYRIDPNRIGTMILHTPPSLIPGMLLLGSKEPAKMVSNLLYPVPVQSIANSYYYMPDDLRIIAAPSGLSMMQRYRKNEAVCVCGGKQMFEIATSSILNGGEVDVKELEGMMKNFKAGCTGCISLQINGRSDIQNIVQSRVTLGHDFFVNPAPLMKKLVVERVSRVSGAKTITEYGFTVDPVHTRVMTDEKFRARGHILTSMGINNFRTALNVPTLAKIVVERKNKEKTSPTSGGNLERDLGELNGQIDDFISTSVSSVASRILGSILATVEVQGDVINIHTNIKRIYDSVFLLYIFSAYTFDTRAMLADYTSKYHMEPELIQAIQKSSTPLSIKCQRKL